MNISSARRTENVRKERYCFSKVISGAAPDGKIHSAMTFNSLEETSDECNC
jgi:hypothetical protein